MENSRTKNAIRNTEFAIYEQMTHSVMSFLCRTIFIYTLGKTYLGFNGLFSDILSLLSLTEFGVGTAILYSMYRPAADKAYEKVAALLNTYRKIYFAIGFLMTAVGLCFIPFLGFFISGIPDIPELPEMYLLYLFNTTAGYFFIYKKSILITDQKNYVSSVIYMVVTTAQNILQIAVLLLLHNFIIYLTVQLLCTIANNIAISIYVDKQYVYLRQYKKASLESGVRDEIYANIKAMFVSKLSSVIVTSTDNLLISKFVSTIVLGLYSNYTLFTTMLRTVISKIFEAMTGSVGNLVALGSREQVYQTFRRIWFVNFWLVSFSCVTLFTLINPFIKLWVGEAYLLGEEIVALICLNLYMRLMRNTFLTFMDTFGLFMELRVKCIAEALINLFVSLLFVGPLDMGIGGVLLGTFISNILTNFWYEPYLLFVKKFHVALNVYFKLFLKYVTVTVIAGIFMRIFCAKILTLGGFYGLIVKSVSCCVMLNLFYSAIFIQTKEFKYFISVMRRRLRKRSGR